MSTNPVGLRVGLHRLQRLLCEGILLFQRKTRALRSVAHVQVLGDLVDFRGRRPDDLRADSRRL